MMLTQPNAKKSWRALTCLFVLILIIATGTPAAAGGHSSQGASPEEERMQIRDFQQTAPEKGWLLMNERLYRSEDDGASWVEITPGAAGERRIQDVTFLDEAQGWVLMSAGGAGAERYTLAHTRDAGSSWSVKELQLEGLGGIPSGIAAVHMDWLDAQFGWMVFRLATGSNFSLGRLFITLDGGETWESRNIPLGEPARFVSPHVGWVAGGPVGDQLFRTLDGGQTWKRQAPALPMAEAASYSLPRFNNVHNGLLPVVRGRGEEASAEIYHSEDGGETWALAARRPLESDVPAGGKLPVAAMDADEVLLLEPGGSGVIEMRAGGLLDRPAVQALAGEIAAVSMSSMEAGWARRERAECEGGGDLICTREVEILTTRDGGTHWQPIQLPGVAGGKLTETFTLAEKNAGSQPAIAISDPDTQPYTGHGFDTCQIPTLTQMQTWWNRSPYSAVNLYIGGAVRACPNAALSASYLSQLNSQGWRFIPTWVGPQAACSWFSSRMSWDPATAYNQGIAQADQALNTALNLGLTAADKSGTVIYYDLEAYNIGDGNCRAAANAFISGWVQRMQARGNLGAAYGASCGSAPTDWSQMGDVPDALWVANWYGNAGEVSFDRTASVFGNYCLSDSLWSNHQRIRQYAGGHDETWGGLILNIDSNVLDGPITVPDGKANLLSPSQPRLLGPLNGSTLARTSNTWLAWKTTGDTCSVHVWGGHSLDVTFRTDCSQLKFGVRPGGTYSWQVMATNSMGSTTGPTWRFNIRPYGAGGVQAQVLSATSVKVTWRLSADDPDNVDGYVVYADGAQAGRVNKGITMFQVNNLACNSVHTFLVKAVRQGIESWAVPVSVMTPSCVPVLLTPAGGSVTINLRPRFAWDPVDQATSYRVQVSGSPDFSSLVMERTLPGTAFAPATDMPADTVFYWRARASGAFGTGDWAEALSFRTANPPSVPILLSPAPGEVVTDYTPRLDWEDVSLPPGTTLRYYHVRLATDSKFKTNVQNKWVLASEHTVPTDLAADWTYYWQVRAVNTLGQVSAWSPVWSFRMAP